MSQIEIQQCTESAPSVWTPEAIRAAQAEIDKWKGTPHRDRMAIVGVGIDCVFFVAKVAQAAGIVPEFQIPWYDPTWGFGRIVNCMEHTFTKCFHVQRIQSPQDWRAGDLIIFSVGPQSNHVGLIWEQYPGHLGIWHAQFRNGVVFSGINRRTKAEAQCALRFTAPGLRLDPVHLKADDFKAWAEIPGHLTSSGP